MSDDTSFVQQQLPSVAGMIGAIIARTVISKVYMSRRGTEPPVDPGAPGANWRQAIMWTAVMAAGAAVGRLVSRYTVGEQLDKRMSGRRQLEKA